MIICRCEKCKGLWTFRKGDVVSTAKTPANTQGETAQPQTAIPTLGNAQNSQRATVTAQNSAQNESYAQTAPQHGVALRENAVQNDFQGRGGISTLGNTQTRNSLASRSTNTPQNESYAQGAELPEGVGAASKGYSGAE